MAVPDYYQILEVSPQATPEEIRAAYRRLALKHHPDQARDAAMAEKFHAIQEAYETLRLPARRRAYDETRFYRAYWVKPQPKAAKAGRAALSWVDEFFIQAGGIEAEGPGKGSLRRFTVKDLEAIWSTILSRLVGHGEVRQTIRQFELIAHYISRHPEVGISKRDGERLEEKRAYLNELETLRRGTALPWDRATLSLEDLLRRQRHADARSLLIWRAAHAMTDQLSKAGLFEAVGRGGVPARELAMVDRLEAISKGAAPDRRLGHGYIACRRCGGWALNWGVGAPHCAHCGQRRFVLRPRDERDEWLRLLIGRNTPAFWRQFNLRNAAALQGMERWVWAPLFLFVVLAAVVPAAMAGAEGIAWISVLLFALGWFGGAWAVADELPGDTDISFPDEWDATRAAANAVRGMAAAALAVIGIGVSLQGRWTLMLFTAVQLGAVFFGPALRDLAAGRGRSSGRA